MTLLPHKATSLAEFIVEVKEALDKNMLKERPIEYLFSNTAVFNPTCSGIWAEFGVAFGRLPVLQQQLPQQIIASSIDLLAILRTETQCFD
jgi:hypothetical protein